MTATQAPQSDAVCWVDHCVVPTIDVERWVTFYDEVLGAEQRPFGGDPRGRTGRVAFVWMGPCHVGGSIVESLEPSKGLGVGTPRYSYFVEPTEIDAHRRRLDQHAVPHLDPLRTAEEGEEGTVIRFEDPDGNQLEFWAPVRMPPGAMARPTRFNVGRMSAVAFESRDLARTQGFYHEFLGLEPAPDTNTDTLAFPLSAGGRLVFKQVDELGDRTWGQTRYHTLHTALMVRDEHFISILHHLWEALPEWDFDPYGTTVLSAQESQSLPARTCIHGAPVGNAWKALTGRGDNFCDWDTNVLHFVGGIPVDGSMAQPRGVSEQDYVERERQRMGR